ncbi:MAG TPA: Crp/Fnr family transcriptional regulator [Candidatus Competibacteraceae bacterium]|nr:Crp/Fnr family transcriptional regulator [Candidatus Competibacteraceae bacterium]
MNTPDAYDTLIRRAHLFSALNEEQLAQVKRHMRVIRLAEGERLFDMESRAERFFMVVKGQIKLYRVSLEGNEKVIELVGPGKMFAEAVMFMSRQTYPVNSMAVEESEVLAFDNRSFLELLRASPELCLTLLGEMSMRLHARLNEIDHLTLQNATFRVAHYLCQHLPQPHSDAPQMLQLPAAKNLIASRLAITPETFSRVFHNLSRAGVISVDGRTVTVHDPARLRGYVQD